ncbi:hypothetical protein, partial [Neisseria sicca]|uniref:hypothetical protein n=1 Tax=Neisseria sicca TaxID=490 RepID=UPI001C99003E
GSRSVVKDCEEEKESVEGVGGEREKRDGEGIVELEQWVKEGIDWEVKEGRGVKVGWVGEEEDLKVGMRVWEYVVMGG